MMIEPINGSLSGISSSVKTDGLKFSGFNRVMKEASAMLSEIPQRLHDRMVTPHTGSQQGAEAEKLVKIGTISSKNPTVSNLLIQNPAFRKECWNIIHADWNQDKGYTRIQAGTDIYVNPDTKELLWGDMVQKTASTPVIADASSKPEGSEMANVAPKPGAAEHTTHRAVAIPGVQADGLSENLVKAIEPMIGKTYSDMNCFELLVNGLRKLGIRYGGRDGLGSRLMARAMDKGLPINAYLNGEGLIALSGSKAYGRSFFRISDPAGQAGQVFQEMAPHLEKGSILSFSTESRGHTGIVSSRNGTWTYINSGVMDNPVTGIRTPKGVGEENLNREIETWFQLAARRNESLVITLGKLNQHKLAAFEENKALTVS